MPPPVHSNLNSAAYTSHGSCVKQLLDAEKRGIEKIEKARENRIKKFRQAKIEAEKDISHYREHYNAQIEEKLLQIQKDIQQEQIYFDQLVETLIQAYASRVNEVKHLVIADLINRVLDIQPKIHPNFEVRLQIARTGTYTPNHQSLKNDARIHQPLNNNADKKESRC